MNKLKSRFSIGCIIVLLVVCGTWAFNGESVVKKSTQSLGESEELDDRVVATQTSLPPSKRNIDWNRLYEQERDKMLDMQARKAEAERVEEETENIVKSDVYDQQAYVETVLDKNLKEQITRQRGSSSGAEPLQGQEDLQPLFTDDELAELEAAREDRNEDSDLIPGGFSSRINQVSRPQPLVPDRNEENDDEPEEDPEPNLFEGQARGYVMLYAMQPNARQTVEAQVNALLASEVRDVYLAILTDGTFGKDFNYLSSLLQRISGEARRWITLQLYLTNGATMRHYDRTPIAAGFNKIEPSRFRELIQNDPVTRERFRTMVQEVRPIYELNLSLHRKNRNIATVMLEDNLDEDSYRAMREIAGAELGGLVQFYRNPCEGCYDGNDSVSLGDPIEAHRPHALPFLTPRDGLNLDGLSYHFPWEEGGDGLSIPQLQEVITVSLSQGLQYFGLWREQRQGLQRGGSVHPNQRFYEVPTSEQLQIEIELLKLGLQKPFPDEPQETVAEEE